MNLETFQVIAPPELSAELFMNLLFANVKWQSPACFLSQSYRIAPPIDCVLCVTKVPEFTTELLVKLVPLMEILKPVDI